MISGAYSKTVSLISTWLLVIVCVASFVLMAVSSSRESAIMDELAHIPSGYGYVRYLDYRLNPEHPPLVKTIAAFPLLFQKLNFPTQSPAWTTNINGQWDMGAQFLFGSGNDADSIVGWARLGPMLLTVFLTVLIYLWSRELLGRLWALLPASLFAFSPTVLAHGHYVTTDIGAAFGVVSASYYFLKFLREPSRRHLIYSGLSLGIAEIMKFSTVLLIPYFAMVIFIFYVVSVIRDWYQTDTEARLKRFFIRGFRYLRALIVIFVIGYAVIVYPVYFLFTVNYPQARQTSETEFILGSFAGGPGPAGKTCSPVRCLADLNIWMTKSQLLRPMAEYMLGVLMVIQRSAGGNTNYFFGEVSASGSRLYFPVVYLLKEPIPVIILAISALVYSLMRAFGHARKGWGEVKRKILDYLEINFAEFSMAVFIIFYLAWSMKSPLNIGFRHLLPILPLIYILTASAWKKMVTKVEMPQSESVVKTLLLAAQAIFLSSLKYVVLVLLFFWFVLETVLATPHFLSYFNEFAGGTSGGYRYVTDSNYDWGQDLLYLKKWSDSHPEADKIAVDYFGGGSPRYYLGDKAEGWSSGRGNPANEGIHWFAVSVNNLQGAIQPLAPGQRRQPQDEYRWLTDLRPPKPGLGNVPEPDYKAGTSIFIYKL